MLKRLIYLAILIIIAVFGFSYLQDPSSLNTRLAGGRLGEADNTLGSESEKARLGGEALELLHETGEMLEEGSVDTEALTEKANELGRRLKEESQEVADKMKASTNELVSDVQELKENLKSEAPLVARKIETLKEKLKASDSNEAKNDAPALGEDEASSKEDSSARLGKESSKAQGLESLLTPSGAEIYFDWNSIALTTSAVQALRATVKTLRENPAKTLKLIGHTDSTGEVSQNEKVSRLRAWTVKEYLVRKGIGSSRILIEYQGALAPKSDNKSISGRQLNRRVDVEILG